MWDNTAGICPLRAPTKHMRDEVIMCTDRPPKADMATMIGMISENPPIILLPKVCKEKKVNQLETQLPYYTIFYLPLL